jgi:4-azaleucine resistance transporter AzlC
LAFALAAQAAGLSATQTVAMSVLVNAGASQLTAVGLLASGADTLSIAFATLLVNLRLAPLGVSLAPLLRHLGRFRRAVLAFSLTDPSYGMSVRRLQEGESGAAFFLGSGASLYLSWVVCTGVGLLIGGAIPDPQALGLHLVFPLGLMVLLMPFLHSRPAWIAALVAGGVALGARVLLPGSWYVLIAAAVGSLAGALLEESP